MLVYSVRASTKPSKINQLKSYKNQLRLLTNNISGLSSKISKMEERLSHENNRYIHSQKILTSIQAEFEGMMSLESRLKQDLELVSKKAKSLYRYLIIQGLEENSGVDLLEKKILTKSIKHYLNKFQNTKKQLSKIQVNMNLVRTRLNEYEKTSKDLYSLVLSLEDQKKDLAHRYLKSKSDRAEYSKKISKLKFERTKKSLGIKKLFKAPIAQYKKMKKDKKGVVYIYRGTVPVTAASAGQIVYNGELASYGNVIMIDHGHEMRSLILGDVRSKVKKGDQVKRGEILGYTVDSERDSSLYFEIRRKNTVQNTSKWLDKRKV